MSEALDFEKWEAAIGKIILSFARVEGELFMKYDHYFSRRKYFDDTFEERVEKIEELYCEDFNPTPESILLFKQVRELVGIRNLVAHNPIYANSSNGEFCFRISKSTNENDHLSYSEIEEKAELIFNVCTSSSTPTELNFISPGIHPGGTK